MKTPTVLDYVKSLFSRDIRNSLESYVFKETQKKRSTSQKPIHKNKFDNKKLYFALALALLGQYLLEPPQTHLILAGIFYLAAIIIFFKNIKNENDLLSKEILLTDNQIQFIKIRYWFLLPGLFFLVLAFFFFENNSFSLINITFWLLGIIFFIISLWQDEEKRIINRQKCKFFTFVCIVVFVIAVFYRFHLLNEVPGEMFSDHAEKLLDIMDILKGQTPIFFTRNTGREALQFYLTAAIIKIFNSGISFISLKIGTAFMGFIAILFIFLLGRLLFNRWVGISAALFSAIAYWPNVLSRVGLRFPLYPLFTAITLFFLYKGLIEKRINQFILSGFFLGLGLHGYSPIRIVPILVGIIVILYIYTMKDRRLNNFVINGFLILSMTALILFLPLLKYALENPGSFNYRALSRLTSMEAKIDQSILYIFGNNLLKSMIMFFYRNGVVWVNSIPNRPALDYVSAVFFLFGLITLIKNLSKNWDWQASSLLVSIPILMLPSIMSIAFPQENPALNRSGGAIVPIFIIIGVGFYGFWKQAFNNATKLENKVIKYAFLLALIVLSMRNNYDLVFNKYSDQFLANAWNSSEIGDEIRRFINKGNNPDNAFVVPFPHWVDTRLVGINAGRPEKDYALWPENFASTLNLQGEKLFILMPKDLDSLNQLKLLYPVSQEDIYYSKTLGKNFILFRDSADS